MRNQINDIIRDIAQVEEKYAHDLALVNKTKSMLMENQKDGYIDINNNTELSALELYKEIVEALRKPDSSRPFGVREYKDKLYNAEASQSHNVIFI